MTKEEPLFHLLKPKEFRVWCVPSRPPGPKMAVTNLPSKATCVNCLTKFRYATGRKAVFRVAWTSRDNPLPRTPKLED